MSPSHVLDEVDREVARRAPERLPPGVRLLLDLARAGKCGEHVPDEGLARVAQATGEWNEDRASSDAFLDLAYALRNLSPEGASNELCAGALAEAWRRTYPFRRGREGDPLEVLVPQLDDARATRALDRARALPRPPRLSFGRLFGSTPSEPFDRGFAAHLIAEADYRLSELPIVRDHTDLTQASSRVARVRSHLAGAREWATRRPLKYDAYLDQMGYSGDTWSTWFQFTGHVDAESDVTEPGDDRWPLVVQFKDAAEAARQAILYVSSYNTQLRELMHMRKNLERALREGPRPEWGDFADMTETLRTEIQRIEDLFHGEDV